MFAVTESSVQFTFDRGDQQLLVAAVTCPAFAFQAAASPTSNAVVFAAAQAASLHHYSGYGCQVLLCSVTNDQVTVMQPNASQMFPSRAAGPAFAQHAGNRAEIAFSSANGTFRLAYNDTMGLLAGYLGQQVVVILEDLQRTFEFRHVTAAARSFAIGYSRQQFGQLSAEGYDGVYQRLLRGDADLQLVAAVLGGAVRVPLTAAFSMAASEAYNVTGAFGADNAVTLVVSYVDGMGVLDASQPCTVSLMLQDGAYTCRLNATVSSCRSRADVSLTRDNVVLGGMGGYYGVVNGQFRTAGLLVSQGTRTARFVLGATSPSGLTPGEIAAVVVCVIIVVVAIIIIILFAKGVLQCRPCPTRRPKLARSGRPARGPRRSLHKYSIKTATAIA